MSGAPEGRLVRGDDRDGAQRAAFDAIAEGRRVGLSRDLSLLAWDRAQRDAETDPHIDPLARFRELARQLVKRGVRSLPEAGRSAGTERHAAPRALLRGH